MTHSPATDNEYDVVVVGSGAAAFACAPGAIDEGHLGRREKGPFTAFEVVIGNLGAKGGVVTDEHARALRADGL